MTSDCNGTSNSSVLSMVPWRPLLAWGAVLLAFYTLRHFFFVIFLTFIISYSIRTLVVWILDSLPGQHVSRLTEMAVVTLSFLALLGCLYGVGAYLVPEFIRQGEGLVKRISRLEQSPQAAFDDLLRDSVGRLLYQQSYGDLSASERAEQLEKFKSENLSGVADSTNPIEVARLFERVERQRLVHQWKQGEFATKLQAKAEEYVVGMMSAVGLGLKNIIPQLLVFPFQLGLILLLSFFITLDVPRISGGLRRLETSRVAKFYNEVAPGLVKFGQLIGRAFQAQAVIAIVNSILTFLSLKFLGIQNEVFLCTFVFLCSFIPVVGVVFSSVPIALMAIIQEDGGLLLALWAILAILIIHFIETSLLNPRIVGNMLHLDPVLVLGILAISEHFFGVWGLLLGVPVAVYIIRIVILEEPVPTLRPD